MANSREMRRLRNKWLTGGSWPKRLEWLEIKGLRGWDGQRIEFNFPMVAVVGENGAGKSTILQAAASVYRAPKHAPKQKFASDFFPDTAWDEVKNVMVKYSVREGDEGTTVASIRKPTTRWRGNLQRKIRRVYYIDLSRIQPLSARAGYKKLAKSTVSESRADSFASEMVQRLSNIMGIHYDSARLATTTIDSKRTVSVVERNGIGYSGFHQGAGELTSAELLSEDFEKYSLVIIDEIESSLHPRAQRRLIRDLATQAREKEIQFIISTHSPYVLAELPPEGRIYIVESGSTRSTVTGVSPEFAMSRMDEEDHPECDVYVEDDISAMLVKEAIIKREKDLVSRIEIIPYGAASVGRSLGLMVEKNKFPRPSVVFLDGDQTERPGVVLLPGEESPERFVFGALKEKGWPSLAERLDRGPSDVIDSLDKAMTLPDHHDWLKYAADPLYVGSSNLWQVMCASWAANCATKEELEKIVLPIKDALSGV